MLTSHRPKNAKMRLVVDQLWCASDMGADGYETVMPSGRAQIIFSLSKIPFAVHDSDSGLKGKNIYQIFQGPSSRPRRISRKPYVALCGVSFYPGGAGALFDRIDDTVNCVVPLSRFWGADASRLGAQLRTLDNHHARLNLLEKEIGKRISVSSEIMALNQGLKLLREGIAINQVCNELGCSPYVFRELFRRNVGFTPKHYLRIERFRSVTRKLTPAASLADVAFDTQFSDQSHMTRDKTILHR